MCIYKQEYSQHLNKYKHQSRNLRYGIYVDIRLFCEDILYTHYSSISDIK